MSKAKNNLPKYLNKYITKQDYSKYTAIDQSVWRYIMFISVPFYKEHAHSIYLEGLKKTGIPLDHIPDIDKMDDKLDHFGWGAVAVKGFIPPTAFMDMLANKVLAIGVDIRTSEHLMYTSAPDIIHETAGHAPIIADNDYANYLCSYGEISKKAISSKTDIEAYEIIRILSDLKENPNATKSEVKKYENLLIENNNLNSYVSEASELARMNWWTAEYGMIGSIDNPKIYGAGLLSSVVEGYESINPKVKKIDYNLDCIKYNYDITEQQPQLFVTDNFKKLTYLLNKYANTMAYKTGGISGLKKAQLSNTVTTSVLDSNISISGILKEFHINEKNISYLQFSGPTQLCYNNNEITGHSVLYHKEGFGCPIGKLKNINKTIYQCDKNELEQLGISINQKTTIHYQNGIIITGEILDIHFIDQKPLIIKITNCEIKLNNTLLFNPSWGDYDLISGLEVISVYGGPADYNKYYLNINDSLDYIQSSTLTENNKLLNDLYSKVDMIKNDKEKQSELIEIFSNISNNYSNEWLILFEIINVISDDEKYSHLKKNILNRLELIAKNNEDHAVIIKRGVDILSRPLAISVI